MSKTKTTVDGKDAVVDGTVPREERMVEPDIETLVIELSKRTDVLNKAKSERGRASNAVKLAGERRDELVGVLAARGVRLISPDLPLDAKPFDARSDAERDGFEDEEDDDDDAE